MSVSLKKNGQVDFGNDFNNLFIRESIKVSVQFMKITNY